MALADETTAPRNITLVFDGDTKHFITLDAHGQTFRITIVRERTPGTSTDIEPPGLAAPNAVATKDILSTTHIWTAVVH
jgi:hypothetical protein